MNNLIYVSVDLTCNLKKNGEPYITALVKLPTKNNLTSKAQDIILKPKSKDNISFSAWQLLCAIHNKTIDANQTLSLKNAQAYLIKGYTYKPYYLVRVILHERISLSIFLDDNQINLLNNHLTIDGEFMDKDKYEIVPFEKPIKA